MHVKRSGIYKYLLTIILPVISMVAIYQNNILVYLPLIYGFGIIPMLEFFITPDDSNCTPDEASELVNTRSFDYLLYIVAFSQIIIFGLFIREIATTQQIAPVILAGKITAMGLMCGVVGINVAHELGHRKTYFERALAKLLLLTSLYMHFIIEHNRGHHKRVATQEDPATAKLNEPIFVFWVRSIIFSYISAWHLERTRINKKNLPWWYNEMMWFQIIQASLLISLYFAFGWLTCLAFFLAALMGILQLETVNYIEHYGLMRTKTEKGTYVKVMPWHSWNSNHILGRLVLFELSRHSDHHYKASKKYQILEHHQDSPQMPTGYPGMMVLSLLPPLWFYVMNNRIAQYEYKLNTKLSQS